MYEKRIKKLVKAWMKNTGWDEKEARKQLMINIKEEQGEENDMGRAIGVMEQGVRDGLLSV